MSLTLVPLAWVMAACIDRGPLQKPHAFSHAQLLQQIRKLQDK